MSRYNEYENRLHRIVLHSADVLPEKVGTYLSELAKSRNYDTKKDVISRLQDFKPLADSISREFVDFVISALLKKPINTENHPISRSLINSSPEDRKFVIIDNS